MTLPLQHVEWEPSEHFLRAVLGGLGDALFIYRPDATLNYVNTAALAEQFTYLYPAPLTTSGEPVQTVELTTLDEEVIPFERWPLNRALRGETFDTEYRVRNRDTGQRWLHSCRAWSTGSAGGLQYVILAEDHTRHREAEERFSTCFCENPIPTIIVALEDFEVLDVNPSFLEITGFEKEELQGKDFRRLEMFKDEAQAQHLTRSLVEHSPDKHLDLTLHAKNGEVYEVAVNGRPITLHGDACWLGTLLDITERKQTEEQLMQAIQEVMQDTAWFSRSVMEKLAQLKVENPQPSDAVSLTKREKQLLELVAKGLDNAQIQSDLGLAKTTVRNYIARIYDKLGVHSRAEAVVWARERGIIAR